MTLTLHPIVKAILEKKITYTASHINKIFVFSLPTANGCNKALDLWMKKAGINKYITWHCARLSFSILLQDANVDTATVALMLGHTTTRHVRERLIFQPDSIGDSAAVIVSINKVEDGRWMLRVEDKGIGMSLSTIINYFLNAGASFRLSTIWKEHFLDEKGKAKVLRSGRFGVGALAAFMLAEDPTQIEMKVITRHILSSIDGAYEFTTRLIDVPIQIKYVEKNEPGTIIEIYTPNPPIFMQESTKQNAGKEWDWFCLDRPIVERYVLNGKRLAQSVSLPSSIDTSNYDYHWIFPKEYNSIGWTYSEFPQVVCNGIIVISNKANPKYSLEDGKFVGRDFKINIPSISIFDKEGKLPITLDRLRIEYDQLQFLGELREDIEKNILAFLLISAPSKGISKTYAEPLIKTHPAFSEYLKKIPWLLSDTGSVLYCPELLHLTKARNIIELSDISLLPFLLSCVSDEFVDVGYAIDAFSLWDDIDKKAIKTRGATRMRIERPKIGESRLYNILDMLNSANVKKHTLRSSAATKIESYIGERFGPGPLESNRELLHVIGYEIRNLEEQELNPRLKRELLDLIFHIQDSQEGREPPDGFLKELLYRLTARRDRLSSEDMRIAFDEMLQRFGGHRYERDNEELIYRIEREIDNIAEGNWGSDSLYRLRDEFRFKINRSRPREFNRAILKKIINELKKLNNIQPEIKIEKIGSPTSGIEWEKLRTLDFGSHSMSTPLSEINIEEGFRFSSPGNFLSKIWLEYIGTNEIPFEESSRRDLINGILQKTDIRRHLVHWETILSDLQSRSTQS